MVIFHCYFSSPEGNGFIRRFPIGFGHRPSVTPGFTGHLGRSRCNLLGSMLSSCRRRSSGFWPEKRHWLILIPSGKHTISYGKWQFIDDLPINSMVVFHSYVNVYQRVKKNRMNQTPYSTTIQLHLVIFSYPSTVGSLAPSLAVLQSPGR